MFYCYGEQSLFPESELVHTVDGNIYHPAIHHTHPEHWVSTGQHIQPGTIPGVVSYAQEKGIIEFSRNFSQESSSYVSGLADETYTPNVVGEPEGRVRDD